MTKASQVLTSGMQLPASAPKAEPKPKKATAKKATAKKATTKKKAASSKSS